MPTESKEKKSKVMAVYDTLEERLDAAEESLDGLQERIDSTRELLEGMKAGQEQIERLKDMEATSVALQEEADKTAQNVVDLMGDVFYTAHVTTRGLPITGELAEMIAQNVVAEVSAEAESRRARETAALKRSGFLLAAWIVALIVALFYASVTLGKGDIAVGLLVFACMSVPLLLCAWMYRSRWCAIVGILCGIAGAIAQPAGAVILVPQIVLALIGLIKMGLRKK